MSGRGTTDQDARALVYLARRLRDETHGCNRWDEAGTWPVFRDELIGQNLALSMERVMCHATDPEAKGPGSIKRPFTPPKPSDREPTKRGNPKPGQDCPRHPGHWADTCDTAGPCAAPAPYDDAPVPPPSWEPGDAKAGAELARAAMHGKTGPDESEEAAP